MVQAKLHCAFGVMLTLLLASACNKKTSASTETSQPPATEPAAEKPAEPAPTYGITIAGSNDLDPCGIVTPADLQPVLGKTTRAEANAVNGISTCGLERGEGAANLLATVNTTAGVRRNGIGTTARDAFKRMTEMPTVKPINLSGVADEAAFVTELRTVLVLKGDVEFELATAGDPELRGLTLEDARKLAPIIAKKLAALPPGSGQPGQSAGSSGGAIDPCSLVSDADASAITGRHVRGQSVRLGPVPSCSYDEDSVDVLSVIVWTADALRKQSNSTPQQYLVSMKTSPGKSEKVSGLGDDAVLKDGAGLFVLAKNVVLNVHSQLPLEKQKLFVAKALPKL